MNSFVASIVLLLFGLFNEAHATAREDPQLRLTQTSPRAILGQPLHFRCDVTAAGTAGVVIFKRNLTVHACSVKRRDCVQYVPSLPSPQYACNCVSNGADRKEYFLNITAVNEETAVDWVCEFQRKSNAIKVQLTDVEGPTKAFLDKPPSISVMRGGNVTLTCSTDACIPDCVYRWQSDAGELSGRVKGRVMGPFNQTLLLTDIRKQDAGHYTCAAANPYSGITATSTLRLRVYYPPEKKVMDGPLADKVEASIGSSAVLKVSFAAEPEVNCTWYKVAGGRLTLVQNSSAESGPLVTHGNNMAILRLTAQQCDFGMYCVWAENSVGKTLVFMELVHADGESPTNSFYVGVSVGAGAALLLAILVGVGVAVFVSRKYIHMKQALEFPYAKTDKTSSSSLENPYQEIPSPALGKKKTENVVDQTRIPTPEPEAYQKCLPPDTEIKGCINRSYNHAGKELGAQFCQLNLEFRLHNVMPHAPRYDRPATTCLMESKNKYTCYHDNDYQTPIPGCRQVTADEAFRNVDLGRNCRDNGNDYNVPPPAVQIAMSDATNDQFASSLDYQSPPSQIRCVTVDNSEARTIHI